MLPVDSGIIIPKTTDGRILFVLNYLGHTMAGTTDDMTDVTHFPEPDQKDVDWIVAEMKNVFGNDFDYTEDGILS